MYNFLSLLIGVLIATMVTFNGELSSILGNYSSLIVIHILGYIGIVIIMLYKKIKIPFKINHPLWLYSSGAISIFTIMFNNLSFSVLGVSLPIALGLLGQTITSLIFDHYGFFGLPRIAFNRKKIVGVIIITFGIYIMTFL